MPISENRPALMLPRSKTNPLPASLCAARKREKQIVAYWDSTRIGYLDAQPFN